MNCTLRADAWYIVISSKDDLVCFLIVAKEQLRHLLQQPTLGCQFDLANHA